MGLSMAQLEDIQLKIQQGLSDRQIAKSVGRRRCLISEIRKGQYQHQTDEGFPDWMQNLNWDEILKEIAHKHPIKFIWEEYAQELTSYSNFTKYLHKKFPYLNYEPYTHRDFNPADRVEVDWAGGTIDWIDVKTRKLHKAYVFISCLGYSQKIFAYACSSMKQADFLSAHEQMFNFYGGVPKTIVPDNTKTAVIKSDRYDPEINSEYFAYTKHYGVSVVPARAYKPKDKALVEGAVKLVMRYFRWRWRKQNFSSLTEINLALAEVIKTINSKKHSRFKVSRNELFDSEERITLNPLPQVKYELYETKICKVHPDGMIHFEHQFYSVPYRHCGSEVTVKYSTNLVEVYLNLEKIAVHPRLTGTKGKKSIDDTHMPENALAYRTQNAQSVLQQARFLSPDLHALIEELFQENTCGYLRRAFGFIREARRWKSKVSHDVYKEMLRKAIHHMKLYNKVRVETLKEFMKTHIKEVTDKEYQVNNIQRNKDNPMLRREMLH